MLAAIVMLDMKGYSGLSSTGVGLVFTELLPLIRQIVDGLAEPPIDVNTWGDGVIAVFGSMPVAAKYALEVKNLMQRKTAAHPELKALRARIAIHLGDLSLGSDKLRELASSSSHCYGKDIVTPARLEPLSPVNAIIVSSMAQERIRRWLEEGTEKAKLVDWDTYELRGEVSPVKTYLLLHEDDVVPSRPASSLAEKELRSQIRLSIVRAVAELTERYRSIDKTGLNKARRAALLEGFLKEALRIIPARDPLKTEADILRLHVKNKRRQFRFFAATDENYRNYIPEMFIPQDPKAEPSKSGLASYVVWANFQADPPVLGVGVAPDVRHSSDITYHVRRDTDGVIIYEPKTVRDMYKPVDKPPYVSILSVPIPKVINANSKVAGKASFEALGVLNISSKEKRAFDMQDLLWAETLAATFGAMISAADGDIDIPDEKSSVVSGAKRKVGHVSDKVGSPRAKTALPRKATSPRRRRKN